MVLYYRCKCEMGVLWGSKVYRKFRQLGGPSGGGDPKKFRKIHSPRCGGRETEFFQMRSKFFGKHHEVHKGRREDFYCNSKVRIMLALVTKKNQNKRFPDSAD